MTAALSGHHPGAEVDTVTVELRDDRTNRRARLGLTGTGLATVFVKAAYADLHTADALESISA
jgi:hypothetical protein